MTVQFNDAKPAERLEELRLIEEEELAKVLAKRYAAKYVDLTRIGVETDALALVPEAEAKASEIAAFKKMGKRLLVAMRAPSRPDSLESLKKLERLGYTTETYMVSRASLKHAWERYADISFATASEGGVLNLSNETIAKMKDELKTINDVRIAIDTAMQGNKIHHVSRVLEILVGGALALDASDIHIEPEDTYVHVRFRIDGVLTEAATTDGATYHLLRSRIKLLSGMKLNVSSAAQDGRFSIKVGDKEIEIRTSLIPGSYGESIVTRILDPHTIGLPLEALGMDKYLMEIFKNEISKPNGMLLNTGPTGSGKTTTLYAFLKAVHTPDVKIITLENPVEYHLDGIVQTQITRDYTFAQGLRAILRQDPDVIMVGEIRDPEVASTAVNAALTGHLVFSTLHTNNAAGTFPRIIDLGISPEIIGASLTVSMAQRLTRKLCGYCKKEVECAGADKEIIDKYLKYMPHQEDLPENRTKMWLAQGCEKCANTGYKGRIAVLEAVLVDHFIEEVVRQNPTEADIWRASAQQNIRRMAEDGICKILKGVTSLDELGRVVDLKDEMFRDPTRAA
jgi:type II secretory ATPase GspE/PulE/Tfp pilus assembly ATPase PilB-like protein